MPRVSADYCFLANEGEEGSLTVIVIKCQITRMIFAHVVMAKGRQFPDTVAELIRDLRRLGYKRVVFRTDQEPPIQAVISAVKDSGLVEAVPELSGAYEKSQNGPLENCVQKGGASNACFEIGNRRKACRLT